MNSRELTAALVTLQEAGAALPSDPDGLHRTLGELDRLIGALSDYIRGLSSTVETFPDGPVGVRLDQGDSPVTVDFVCTRVANHLQAAAAGMDQAQGAVRIAHHLGERLHPTRG
jgi:hypothetical protein